MRFRTGRRTADSAGLASATMPTPAQLAALKTLLRYETTGQGRARDSDAESCVAAGWADSIWGGQFQLTDEGRRLARFMVEEAAPAVDDDAAAFADASV